MVWNDVSIKGKVPTHHWQAPSYYEKKFLVRSISMEQALSMYYVHMYICVHVFMYSLTRYCYACFKHRLLGQNHDSESVGFIRVVLVYTAKVLYLYLGLFYTTFHE